MEVENLSSDELGECYKLAKQQCGFKLNEPIDEKYIILAADCAYQCVRAFCIKNDLTISFPDRKIQ